MGQKRDNVTEVISDEKAKIIEFWTSAILGEPKAHQAKRSPSHKPYTIVFGRTTHDKTENKKTEPSLPCNSDDYYDDSTPNKLNDNIDCEDEYGGGSKRKKSRMKNNSDAGRDFLSLTQNRRLSSGPSSTTALDKSSLSDAKNSATLTRLRSKQHGRQMMNMKHDLHRAREKRSRQMKYSLEVKNSMKNSITLQISSITRVVVQNFRKLIDCERCALFLMDHSTDELYFKPVGDEHGDVDPKEIRFPVTTGVAGWVATNRKALNIKNAYRDHRFNPDIDRQTSFRTRTILCAPVLSLSDDHHLYGVIQMVNKKKGDKETIQSNAKKKKSDSKHHGYESCYETFSDEDAKILHRCSFEVSRALEPVLTSSKETDQKNSKGSGPGRRGRKTIFGSEKLDMMLKAASVATKKLRDTNNSGVSSTSSDAKSNEGGNWRERRRSSCGNLIQFISAEALSTKKSITNDNNVQIGKKEGLFGRDASLGEATNKFQFRSGGMGKQISAKAQLSNDPEFLMAASKRKRMVDYNKQRRQTIHYGA